SKYYRYHRDHGHDTEECRYLKNQIEVWIRKGYLRKYVDRERREEAPQTEEQQPRDVIHTISGGIASRGDHSQARKAYARQTLAVQQQNMEGKRLKIDGEEEVISFSESDYEGVLLPHDDLVVVTFHMELFTIKRVLIDSGSSVVYPLGSIDLSVFASLLPCQTQVQMTFPVVDTPSPYNAIIERSRLNAMEAIVSTRYLLVKFPTRFSVGQIRGDQQAAR
ncbi:LOW QUALITY PROTEIN: hypothetical protein CFOL_v3_22635, partial [Cephalotus follicularis]